ncbi:PAS domain-containing protein [Actinoplanes awajinensis]|uniref:PAS domain-containing protein n=1 Tax=Actinoplanes awajinensis TaxID=135946 RepID=UPI0018DDD46D|nr:PAS domain-containing protein [Actinoplanes awajinensis]
MPRPVCCDAGGLLIFRNRIARDTPLGNTPAHVSDLGGLHEDDPRHPLARALAGAVLVHRETTLHLPGRSPRAVLVDARPLTGADGELADGTTLFAPAAP